jgi:hypothetical protein
MRLCCVHAAALWRADPTAKKILKTVCNIHSFRLILNENWPKGLIRQGKKKKKKKKKNNNNNNNNNNRTSTWQVATL